MIYSFIVAAAIFFSGTLSLAKTPFAESVFHSCRMQNLQVKSKKKLSDEELTKFVASLPIQQHFVLEHSTAVCANEAINDLFKTKNDWKKICPSVVTDLKVVCYNAYAKENPAQFSGEISPMAVVLLSVAIFDRQQSTKHKTMMYHVNLGMIQLLENYNPGSSPFWSQHAAASDLAGQRELETKGYQIALKKLVPTMTQKVAQMEKMPLADGETSAPGGLEVSDLKARIAKLKAKIVD